MISEDLPKLPLWPPLMAVVFMLVALGASIPLIDAAMVSKSDPTLAAALLVVPSSFALWIWFTIRALHDRDLYFSEIASTKGAIAFYGLSAVLLGIWTVGKVGGALLAWQITGVATLIGLIAYNWWVTRSVLLMLSLSVLQVAGGLIAAVVLFLRFIKPSDEEQARQIADKSLRLQEERFRSEQRREMLNDLER